MPEIDQAEADIGYDPFDADVMADPYPYYRKLRARAPIYYTPKYDTFWISTFDGIVEMLEKPRNVLISSESSIPMPEILLKHHDGKPPQASLDPLAPMTLLHSPVYEQVRRAHSKPFSAGSVAELEDFSRQTTRRLLDENLPRGKFDLFLDYGGMLSALLTCKLFNVDERQARYLLETVNASTSYDPARGGIDNARFFTEMKQFMVPSIARRRSQGADGSEPIFDGLINYRLQPDGRALTDDEIADELACAFIANTETPGKVAARGLLELQRLPDQLAEVRSDLARNVPVAAEEMLRLYAPAQWFLRTIHEDTEIGGIPMRAGQRVAGLVCSASRDERQYENSEEFVWNRPIRKQLSFGLGLHHCLGLHIARLQIRVLVEEFLRRVDEYSFDLDQAVLRPSYFHCAYSSLPVIVSEVKCMAKAGDRESRCNE